VEREFKNCRIAVIGVGKIGEGILRGLLKAGYRNLIGTVKTARRREAIDLPVEIILDNRKAVKDADIVFLCVKPYQVKEVLEEISDLLQGKLLISVAAAISTSYIEKLVKDVKVVRAMPNISIIAGYSATAISPGSNVTEEELQRVKELFDSMGYCVVVDERYMDAVTAYSGSGPAYVLVFYEAMLLAGLKVGLPREVASELAVHTMIGSVYLLNKAGKHPAELRDMVITPGGVTIDAIHVLEQKGFRAILIDAIDKAYEKSKKLSETLDRELTEKAIKHAEYKYRRKEN